jgi:serine protease
MLLFSIITISFAKIPFHKLTVEKQRDDFFNIDGVDFNVLPAVIIQGSSENIPNEAISIGGESYLLHTESAEDSINIARELSKQPGLISWPDVILKKYKHNFNDPYYEGQWYIENLGMESLFELSLGSSQVLIAVIDSGIDISHPDLQAKIVAPFDAFNNDNDPSPNFDEYCYNDSGICDEHGTAVSGIATASANNESGIVGFCPDCSLVPIKMLGESGGTLSADIMAFEHCIDNNVDVINNSWGYTEVISVPEPLENVINRAATQTRDGKGSVIIFAAGNDDREILPSEICGLESVLCISAIDNYNYPTAYTNFGSPVDIAAPSATVSIAPLEQLTTTFGGTSAAAPVVSGIAGWILSQRPDYTSQEVRNLLIATAQPSPLVTHDEFGHHINYGYGIVSPNDILLELFPIIDEPKKSGCNSLPFTIFLLPIFLLYPRKK